jgi:hypothetical protein
MSLVRLFLAQFQVVLHSGIFLQILIAVHVAWSENACILPYFSLMTSFLDDVYNPSFLCPVY